MSWHGWIWTLAYRALKELTKERSRKENKPQEPLIQLFSHSFSKVTKSYSHISTLFHCVSKFSLAFKEESFISVGWQSDFYWSTVNQVLTSSWTPLPSIDNEWSVIKCCRTELWVPWVAVAKMLKCGEFSHFNMSFNQLNWGFLFFELWRRHVRSTPWSIVAALLSNKAALSLSAELYHDMAPDTLQTPVLTGTRSAPVSIVLDHDSHLCVHRHIIAKHYIISYTQKT